MDDPQSTAVGIHVGYASCSRNRLFGIEGAPLRLLLLDSGWSMDDPLLSTTLRNSAPLSSVVHHMHLIHHIIIQYGYPGVFGLLMFGIIGLPVPDETLLAFCGYLANKGELNLVLTIMAAFLGSCSGITVSYIIGRVPGLALIKKYGKHVHFTEDRIDKVHLWFEKVGKWLLVFGYFIPGVRHLSAMVAGSSKLQYFEFAPFAYTGALLWSATFVIAGYIFGKEWERLSGDAHRILLIAGGILVVLAVGWWFLRYLQKKKARIPVS